MTGLKLSRAFVAIALTAGITGLGTPLSGQHPVDGVEWSVAPIRATGQIVTPVFEGWFRNPDGSYTLSFGYFNMNTQEVIDIPIGPNNYVEPAEFNGLQPTRFDPIPTNGARRHWGVFAVQVPADFGERRVVWVLTHAGQTYAVPGHVGSSHYILEDLYVPTQGDVAAAMRIGDGEEEKRGRGFEGFEHLQPLTVRAGQPLRLSVVIDPNPEPTNRRKVEQNLVWWFKHQGPGEVSFSEKESTVKGVGEAVTTATFSEPGEYIVRAQAVESVATLEFHCCWTNGFIRVNVTD